jgi:monothiol glutaredoxin, Grx4 family
MNLEDKIKDEIKNNPIMLYMKGTKLMPMCGFSATIVNILNAYGVEYEAINVLEDPEIRIKLSEYSDWPTIPQLFVNGELIGGCDIAMELHNNGELKNIFEGANK